MSSESTRYVTYVTGEKLPISEEEFQEVTQAESDFAALDRLDDLFELFAEAFLNYEKLCLDAAIESIVFSKVPEKREGSLRTRAKLDLALNNLLNSGRAFDEQAPKILKSASVDLGLKYKTLASKVFDESFEYRVMYGLRNGLFHWTSLVTELWYNQSRQWESGKAGNGPSRGRVSAKPRMRISKIFENPKIKQKLKDEIEDRTNGFQFIDLNYFCRGYAEGLSTILLSFHSETDETLINCEASFKRFSEAVSSKFKEERNFFILPQLECDHQDWVSISPKKVQNLRARRALWQLLPGVQRIFVTGEISKSRSVFPSSDESVWIVK